MDERNEKAPDGRELGVVNKKFTIMDIEQELLSVLRNRGIGIVFAKSVLQSASDQIDNEEYFK